MARCACNAMTSEDCDCPRTWTCNCGEQFTSYEARHTHTCQQTTAIPCDGCDELDARIAELESALRKAESERFTAIATYSKRLADEQTLHRETQRQLDEARVLCSAWIRNSNDKAAEVNTLATDLDEARALVESATCFAFGGTSRPAFAYRTQFGHVDNDVTWCAGVPEGDDVECESRDSAIAKARALAKEDGK